MNIADMIQKVKIKRSLSRDEDKTFLMIFFLKIGLYTTIFKLFFSTVKLKVCNQKKTSLRRLLPGFDIVYRAGSLLFDHWRIVDEDSG